MFWWEPELFGQTNPIFDTLEIAYPYDLKIAISAQWRSAKNTKIGDRQCTYFLIVRALNISNFYFFVTICMRV